MVSLAVGKHKKPRFFCPTHRFALKTTQHKTGLPLFKRNCQSRNPPILNKQCATITM